MIGSDRTTPYMYVYAWRQLDRCAANVPTYSESSSWKVYVKEKGNTSKQVDPSRNINYRYVVVMASWYKIGALDKTICCAMGARLIQV